MKKNLLILLILSLCLHADETSPMRPQAPESPFRLRIGMLSEKPIQQMSYPGAFNSLLKHIVRHSTTRLDTDPLILRNFESDEIFTVPFIYANYADRSDWKFSEKEVKNLRRYLTNGGVLYIDAGINSEFLRDSKAGGQRHSFADWEVSPDINDAFKQLFPNKKFRSLARSHQIFKTFYQGLPDPELLPEKVRQYVVQEKWPNGTYSLLGLEIDKRLSVICSPIIAMGWAKNDQDRWVSNISFRILESAPSLDSFLSNAANRGNFKSRREDGLQDKIFLDVNKRPAWCVEPDGTTRAFNYYPGDAISDYAHRFYTRLGTNILIYSLTF